MAIKWSALDYTVTPLLAAAFTVPALASNPNLLWLVPLGYVCWVFFEWWMHAKLFHRIWRKEHWGHHLHPADESVDVPFQYTLGAQLLAVLLALTGPGSAALLAGFLGGYATYLHCHRVIHQGLSPFGLFGPMVRRHTAHHRGLEMNFNLLCPLGDIVMGTYKPIGYATFRPD